MAVTGSPTEMNFPKWGGGGGRHGNARLGPCVLSAPLDSNGAQLDDESFSTLMCKAEAIVNSRPLTVNPLSDPDSPSPLTPNHLLTMKSKIVMPPPGIFQDADKYSRRRWRKEFLQSLQIRPKWVQPCNNLCVNDIVIIKDDNHSRNQSELARLLESAKARMDMCAP